MIPAMLELHSLVVITCTYVIASMNVAVHNKPIFSYSYKPFYGLVQWQLQLKLTLRIPLQCDANKELHKDDFWLLYIVRLPYFCMA